MLILAAKPPVLALFCFASAFASHNQGRNFIDDAHGISVSDGVITEDGKGQNFVVVPYCIARKGVYVNDGSCFCEDAVGDV